MAAKRVLLVEPGYRNKYPPLGLMKLATYHRGRGDFVCFVKLRATSGRLVPDEGGSVWDRVYVTTLFSFEWKRTSEAIDFAICAAGMQPERVFVGGIAASLMNDTFTKEPSWAGVRFIKGLLVGPPARALQLREQECEFGAEDLTGQPIEELTPDYSILSDIDYEYPVRDAYFGYASRGCVRKCSFCGVPKLEGDQREMPSLSKLIHGVDSKYGRKRDLVLMDNNVTAAARFQDIISEIRDLGFERGAKFVRDGGSVVGRRVDFNQGVDARILAKSSMFLREMSTICISPLRIAFDHMGVRRVYEQAVRMAAENEITALSNYMLYNFMDTPSDLYCRMRINIELNQELGVRIWSFPMRYLPVTDKHRGHVGRNWSRYFLRSFQIMLQATHGVVSGSPSFFDRAYGCSMDEFIRLLSLPHAFIFHRDYYESGRGKPVLDEYWSLRRGLSKLQQQNLMDILSDAGSTGRFSLEYFELMSRDRSLDSSIRKVLRFHTLDTRHRLSDGGSGVQGTVGQIDLGLGLPREDERVEDAGLYDDAALA